MRYGRKVKTKRRAEYGYGPKRTIKVSIRVNRSYFEQSIPSKRFVACMHFGENPPMRAGSHKFRLASNCETGKNPRAAIAKVMRVGASMVARRRGALAGL